MRIPVSQSAKQDLYLAKERSPLKRPPMLAKNDKSSAKKPMLAPKPNNSSSLNGPIQPYKPVQEEEDDVESDEEDRK